MTNQAQYRKGCIRTLVLKLLSESPMYGYEIATSLSNRSKDIFSLGQGTLYPLLYSMQRKGFIATYKQKSQSNDDSKRKKVYYQITAKGAAALQEDLSVWTEIVKGMQLVLGGLAIE